MMRHMILRCNEIAQVQGGRGVAKAGAGHLEAREAEQGGRGRARKGRRR